MNQMKRTLPGIFYMWILPLCCLVLLTAISCGGGNPRENAGAATGTAAPSSAPASAGKDQNACHLLSHEEVSTLVEKKVVMRDQTEAGETWSTCEWQDESGLTLFKLTVYWSNGKREWETWRSAQGLGNQLLKRAEGVSADEVVKQGLVAEIGDGAYFSTLLPSLVLKGDVLLEMNLFFVPQADAKFAAFARNLLAKIQ